MLYRFLALLLAFVACGTILVDRARWVEQTTVEINLAQIPIADIECGEATMVELAPEPGTERFRYRCGAILWPFYKSGVTSASAAINEVLAPDTN